MIHKLVHNDLNMQPTPGADTHGHQNTKIKKYAVAIHNYAHVLIVITPQVTRKIVHAMNVM